jgi:hypothetical protein
MKITTSVNMEGVLKALKSASLKPKKVKRALTLAALGQERDIKTRTAQGKGLYGNFKVYSDEYMEFKTKRKGSSSKVNLYLTGKMLGNLGVVKADHREAVISFSSKSERKKAKLNGVKRPFMGITSTEQDAIAKRFKRALFK